MIITGLYGCVQSTVYDRVVQTWTACSSWRCSSATTLRAEDLVRELELVVVLVQRVVQLRQLANLPSCCRRVGDE